MTIKHERSEAGEFFARSFLALTGYPQMPWQFRLFRTHFLPGDLPAAVSIPTGLGKTAVMAVWLIGLAWQMRTQTTPSLPRRLVYVVDRRAVVDQSTTFAEKLREALATPATNELRTALDFTEGKKLAISTLRGQFVDNREWLEDPSRLAIIVGTVDMIGSRLLFEGYGVSRRMRPYHAGLLGGDTLVLLDEAHLVPPFEALLATIANEPATFSAPVDEDRKRIPSFRLLPLSATTRSSGQEAFVLEDADYNDAEDKGAKLTKQRLEAVKRLRIETAEAKNLPQALAEQAWRLAGEGAEAVRCLLYCDKRDDAKAVEAALQKKLAALNKSKKKKTKPGEAQTEVPSMVELFVGARRVHERVKAAARLEELGFLADSKAELKAATFLVATSAGEVGVDLDADHLVCDLVAWERMVQRFGRVNRRGEGNAQIVVVDTGEPRPKKADKPTADESERARIYRAVKQVLNRLKGNDADGFDVSPGALRALAEMASTDEDIRNTLSAASTPPPLRPALTRPLVDAWSMTSLEQHTGRPRVEPWLRGWVSEKPQTTVAWRRYLPVRAKPAPKKAEIEAFFEAAPLHAAEWLETETSRVADWLMQRVEQLLGSRPGMAPERLEELDKDTAEEDAQIASDGVEPADVDEPDTESSMAASGTDSVDVVSVGTICPPLKPDEVIGMIFLPDGSYERSLLAREIPLKSDISPKNEQRKKRTKVAKEELEDKLAGATLVLDARIGGLANGLLNPEIKTVADSADGSTSWGKSDDGKPVIPFRIRDSAQDDLSDEGDWRESLRFDLERNADGEATRWLIVEEWPDSANTEERRSSGPPQSLAEHQSCVEAKARDIARRLGLSDEYTEMLIIAARLHDEGKRASIWQDAFHAPAKDRPYAKTRGPINFSLLDGYRHEFGSLPYAHRNEALEQLPKELQDLALHLIAAHHGFARPVIGIKGCEDAPPSALEARARAVALRFARLQKRWGPWGLAWWESLLRAADQQASRDNDKLGRASGKESKR